MKNERSNTMKNITYMNINSKSSKIRGFEDSKKMDSRIKRIDHYPLSIVHCKLSIIHYSLLIILFLLPLGKVWGQTTVQVGSGTTGTYNIPLNTFYKYSYSFLKKAYKCHYILQILKK